MSEWSQKEIDNLFQEGSEQYPFEYNEEAWKDLERMLDKEERDRSLIWWFSGLLGILILLGSSYFFLSKEKHTELEQEQVLLTEPEVSVASNSSILETQSPTPSDKEDSQSTIVDNIQQIEKQNKSAVTTEKKSSILRSEIQKRLSTTTSRSKTQIDNNRLIEFEETLEKEKSIPTILKRESQVITSTTADLKEENTADIGIIEENTADLKGSPGTISLLDKLPLSALKEVEIPESFTYDKLQTIQEVNQKKRKDNFLSIGLLASIESNTVKETDFCVPRWKIGLHADYHFGKRFNTSIGINYINKEYVAQGASYEAPKGFWSKSATSGKVVIPETVKANCDVLEIPISFSFFPKGYRNKGFYISAGLSSFIMLTEAYQFRYTELEADLKQGWKGQNEHQHLFSEAELALGYHLPFANHTSLLFGPYVQLPITGIGHGNIDVLSIGFTAKYRFHID